MASTNFSDIFVPSKCGKTAVLHHHRLDVRLLQELCELNGCNVADDERKLERLIQIFSRSSIDSGMFWTEKEIAEKMYCSPKTIDGYREDLFIKLNVKSRVGLVVFAIRNGYASV